MTQTDCDYKLKIVLAGNTNVGKSNLLIRYTRGVFGGDLKTTIGVQFSSKIITTPQGRKVKVQMWDTAGQERFRSMAKAYYKGAVVVLLVYDVTSEESFHSLRLWHQEASEYASKDALMFLIGNKIDLGGKVGREKAREFAEAREMKYFEVSALDGRGFQGFATQMEADLNRIVMRTNGMEEAVGKQDVKRIVREPSKKKESSCC